MNNIKLGQINTRELVSLFGTAKLQERYNNGGNIGGRDKELLLNKAKKLCDIEDLTGGKYMIHRIYSTTNNKDSLILPLLKGLSKYLTPLILTKLLNEQDKNYKMTLPFLGWALKFEMVNENYPLIKYHQKKSSEYLNIDEDIMFDYFERMDECIKYHLEKCLNTLSKKSGLDLLEFDSITMVKKEVYKSSNNDARNIFCGYINEVLSDEDRKFVIDCENKAKEIANITDNKEKFYGIKSYNYKKELKKLLSERKILFTYQAYNIFCKNPEEIKSILSTYKSIFDFQEESFIQTFNDNFIEYIESKAKSRQNREIKRLQELEINDDPNIKFIKKYRLAETYVSNFKVLSDMTVQKDSPNLKETLKIDQLEDIVEEFKINIIKIKK